MLGWFKSLFAGTSRSEAVHSDPVDYEGFTLIATPRQVSGGWSTEGIIRKQVGAEVRETTFIRADTCITREDAMQMALSKARTIVDERGDKVFDGPV